MSHDRGCSCGLEPYEYRDCVKQNCSRRDSSIHDPVVKASLFPEKCTLAELESALRKTSNDIQYGNIKRAIERRNGLVNIPSKRMQLQKPRIRVVAGRAPWPVT